jgi:acetyltransferase-like isoleucine patch superfamily enzyme
MLPGQGLKDKASYRHRGGLFQRLVSAFKAWRHFTSAGTGIMIKRTAEFRLAKDAVLEVGDNCTIQDFSFFQLTLPSPKVYIEKNTVIGRRNIITAKNLIRIGDDVLIGSDVQIIDHGHGIAKDSKIREQQALIGEVVIGNDVWVGVGARILMDVHIGTGAVIGANAVVVSDIPDYAIAVGIPARVVKFRE